MITRLSPFSFLYSLLFGALLTLIPMLCAAESSTVWELRNQAKVEGWNTNNLTSVQLTTQGLSVATQTQGQLVKVADIGHSVDRVGISYISPTGGEGLFIWRAPGMKESEVFQISLSFNPSATTQKLVLDLSQIPEWSAKSDRIGFVINPGAQIIFQSVELSGPNMIDQMIFPLRTFFALDSARSYSVNFLWGPLMTYTEDQLGSLYSKFPPNADSWNRVFYAVLAIALVCALLLRKFGKRNAMMWFFALFAMLWIVYDARMGAELISFAKHDIKIWWSKPAELQDFRDRGSFTAYTKNIGYYLEGQEKYVFIASRGWPFWGAMRYETYPSVPVNHEGDTEGITSWLVYDRPDIVQDEEGRLTIDGTPISPPGEIVFPFENGAFVFSASQ